MRSRFPAVLRPFTPAAVALALALAGCSAGAPPVTGSDVIAVRIAPTNPIVESGDTLVFVATAVLVNGQNVEVTEDPDLSWISSSPSIVSVNADGTAQANAAGEALVHAEYEGLKSPPQKVTVQPGPTPTPTITPVNHLVISEVMYNPIDEAAGQYVEIHNPTASPVDMTGWTVNYSGGDGTAFTFPTFTLAAGAYVVLANDQTYFDGTPYPSVANIFTYAMPNFLNGGDWFVLMDDAAALVDEMAYGTGFNNTKPTSWCATNSPTASTNGTSVSRSPVTQDTDNCADWANNTTANPGVATP